MKVPAKKERLEFFKDLYTNARANQEETFDLLERHYRQYRGDPSIDGNGSEAAESATVVRNITYELTESQITTYIPTPKCESASISDRRDLLAMSIEKTLRGYRDRLPVEELNDLDERYTYIYGGSVWLVEWDESIKTHNTVGGIKLHCLSPRHFIGQPYIYNVQDMEYCFIEFETTKEDLVRKYGVSFETAEETVNETSGDDDTATMYVCYYKDDDGNVCQYIWSGDVELLDEEKYYSRKRIYCTKCGKKKQICNCDDAKYETRSEEYEELQSNIVLSDGENFIPAFMPVFDEEGLLVYEEVNEQVYGDNGEPLSAFDTESGLSIPLTEPRPAVKKQPTKIPFYTPKSIPIVIRKNTGKEDSVLGQSDCEFIRPQQQAINKVESRIMQKLMRSGITPYMPEDASIAMNNQVFGQVIRVKPGEQYQYGVIDTQVDISRDIHESDRLYDQAKRILGISDSYQGHYDASAKSGIAKQTAAAQSAGRLDSKRSLKNAAWAAMDRIIFELLLAFADEPRPVCYKDNFGRVQEVQFNRYDFLCLDDNFEWYYDDEFLFSADASVDISTDRYTLWQENRINFEKGAYGDPSLPETQLIFWLNQQKAHYPFAQDNVERIREVIREQQAMAQLQQQIAAQQQQIGQLEADNSNRAAYGDLLLKRSKAQEKELNDQRKYTAEIENEINGGV